VAILRDMPRTATVRAVTEVSLLTMDDGTFRSLVAESLGIAKGFDEIIRARMSKDLTWDAE
jgi:CRP-like cAMP-binding protein